MVLQFHASCLSLSPASGAVAAANAAREVTTISCKQSSDMPLEGLWVGGRGGGGGGGVWRWR